jgi:hypothetical protein
MLEQCIFGLLASKGVLGQEGAFSFSLLERCSLQKEGIGAIDPHSHAEALEAWEAHLHGFGVKVKGGIIKNVVIAGSKVASASDDDEIESDGVAVDLDGDRRNEWKEGVASLETVADAAKLSSELKESEPRESVSELRSISAGGHSGDRNLKATKAYDAQVPVWLWNGAVQEDLEEDPSIPSHSKATITSTLDVIRHFLLCRKSKLGVTWSYFAFIHNQYPELGRPEQPVITWSEGHYDWRRQQGIPIGWKNYRGWWRS